MTKVAEALMEYRKELQENALSIEKGSGESNLLANLNKIIQRNRKVFYLILVMLAIAFVLSISFIWYWRDNTPVLAGVFTATGITIPWVINTTVNLWKDISNAETLHALISHLDDKKTNKEIIKILSEKLYK
jgi:hypothetical protein